MGRPRGTGKPVPLSDESAPTVDAFLKRYHLGRVVTRYASEIQPAGRMANWTPEFRAEVAARADELDALDRMIRQSPAARKRQTAKREPRVTRSQPIARPFATRNVGPDDCDWNVVDH